ncbi:hypothetical protein EV702DRAFT_1058807 [Suillus placidus]|uniref:Uncharacterized protein n=1 Tax=Suillus placidus TaxID=48579 RepID=A0A9P7D8F0_9AGAM|nr:hypothetical protein EV702DRAFT_1058807 [Suillus placidus]
MKSLPALVILCSLKNIRSLSSNVGLLSLGTVHRRRELMKRSGMKFTRCPDHLAYNHLFTVQLDRQAVCQYTTV